MQDTLNANREYIRAEVIGYINTTYSDLLYNVELCSRDVGIIIDAIIIDTLVGGNYQSINAGRAYFRNASAKIASGAQQLETVDGIAYAKYLANQILNNASPATSYQTVYTRVAPIGSVTTPMKTAVANSFDIIARVLIGVGTASVLMATFALFSHWFSKQEFGRVSGFMVALGNLGNLAATAPLALATGAFGWRNSFLVVGVVQAAITVLVFCKVQDKPDSHHAQEEGAAITSPGMMAAWGEIFGTRDFWLLGILAFSWYGNYLALQALWGGPYLMEVLHLSREATGSMLMCTSIGFIVGSSFIDMVARRVFRSYKKTLLAGQLLLLLFMTAFLGWAEVIPHPLLAGVFFMIGLVVSSGVMIYPIIRSMFPVNIVGTALTSLNFYVLMGAAVTLQVMGGIIESKGDSVGAITAVGLHSAFIFPVAGLVISIILYSRAREYGQLN